MNKKMYFRTLAIGLLSAMAFLGTGCSNDELETGTARSNSKEIAFRALGDRPALRASSTGINEITNFTLQGIWQKSGIPAADKRLFDAVVVTRAEDGNSWEYSPKKTWPDGTDGVVFYAYSPANSRNMVKGFKGQDDNPQLEYTVPTSANAQEDLLVAVTDILSSGTVSLNFKHALSRVLVRARTTIAGTSVKIDNITFKNLSTTGKWALEADDLTTAGVDGESTNFTPNTNSNVSIGVPTVTGGFQYATYATLPTGAQQPAYLNYRADFQYFWDVTGSTKASYQVDLSQSAIADNSGYKLITGSLGGMMVMPQQTECTWDGENDAPDPDADFYMEITYRPNGGSAVTKNIKIPDIWKKPEGSFCFEPGKQYTFDLTLDGSAAGAIELAVNEVANWDDVRVVPQPETVFLPTFATGINTFTAYYSDPAVANPAGVSFMTMTSAFWSDLESEFNNWPTPDTEHNKTTFTNNFYAWCAAQLGTTDQLFLNINWGNVYQTEFNMRTVQSAVVSALSLSPEGAETATHNPTYQMWEYRQFFSGKNFISDAELLYYLIEIKNGRGWSSLIGSQTRWTMIVNESSEWFDVISPYSTIASFISAKFDSSPSGTTFGELKAAAENAVIIF